LSGWGIEAQHPDDFLSTILGEQPEAVLRKIQEQAATIDRTVPELLRTLSAGVPRFAASVGARLVLDIG